MSALLLLLAAAAQPAAASSATSGPPPVTAPVKADDDAAEMQRALNDPATAERLSRTLQALSRAMLDLRVGEVQAAVEGRTATEAERRATVRDLGRRSDPNFEQSLERGLASSRTTMQASLKAMSAALPAMMKSLEEAERAMERATANLPSPLYPKR